MLYLAFGLYGKLEIVAVSTVHKPHPLEGLGGEGFNMLLGIADESKTTNPTAISEANVAAIWLQLPARLFVFYRAVIVLKLGIAFLARLVVLAVVIEAGNSKPGTIC